MSRQLIGVPLSTFGFTRDGQVPGFPANPNHPNAIPVAPFAFTEKLFRMLNFAWMREMTIRADHQPRRGLWLAGPKGAGKTTVVEQFFARLSVPVVSLTANRHFSVQECAQTKTLVPTYRTEADGSKTPVGITAIPQDGPLLQAMREGIPLVINELDLADPAELTGLNDIIDRGIYTVPDTGEVVRAERGFIVFVCANSNGAGDQTGEYAGVGAMNTSLMSRFYKVEVDYPTAEEEIQAVIASGVKSTPEIIGKVVHLAKSTREAAKNGTGIASAMSTREVIGVVEAATIFAPLAASGINPMETAVEAVYSLGLPAESRVAVQTLLKALA